MNLTTEQKQAIDERVTIDLVLGNIHKWEGVLLPNSHFEYVLKLGIELLRQHDIHVKNTKAYNYIRSLIWEDNFGCFK